MHENILHIRIFYVSVYFVYPYHGYITVFDQHVSHYAKNTKPFVVVVGITVVEVYHHHHIALVARISLTLSRHSSLSFIALGRSSGQHPVSSHSC